jgi:hypothetical protein
MNEKSTKDQQQGTNTRDIPWGLVSFAILVKDIVVPHTFNARYDSMICLFTTRSETAGNKSNACERPAPPASTPVPFTHFSVFVTVEIVYVRTVLLKFLLSTFACSKVRAIEVTTTC